jgi:hypothetical protein
VFIALVTIEFALNITTEPGLKLTIVPVLILTIVPLLTLTIVPALILTIAPALILTITPLLMLWIGTLGREVILTDEFNPKSGNEVIAIVVPETVKGVLARLVMLSTKVKLFTVTAAEVKPLIL